MMSAPERVPDAERHNHTLVYQRELFSRLRGGGTALDVGCGEGIAARELAALGYRVTGIDLHEESLAAARAQSTDAIAYVHGDVLGAEVEPADVVYAGAMLHHVDLEAGLERLRDLTAPGGTLLVVGLARARMPRDLGWELAAGAAGLLERATKRMWEHGAPTVWPPPHTFAEVRRAASRIVPGARYRRRLLWRDTIEWRRPASAEISRAANGRM